MPYSYSVYTGNVTNDQFAVSFSYIPKEHVFASVNYVNATFTWVNSSTIQLDSVPANAARVEVRRVTPVANPLVDFTDGSTLVAADLDTVTLQQTYINQEQDDQFQDVVFINSQGLLDAGGKRITNVGDPVNAQDVATKTYVDTTTVASAGDAMTGPLAMGDNKITGLVHYRRRFLDPSNRIAYKLLQKTIIDNAFNTFLGAQAESMHDKLVLQMELKKNQ